jgi:transcriptional regulator GlxA family with amidase domain
MSARQQVGILLFDGVELLDFAGPFEVFSAADELRGGSAFEVWTVAAGPEPVRTHNGLVVVPRHAFSSAPRPDLLIVPGGFGTRALLHQPDVLDWIQAAAGSAGLVVSVCTGSLVLAKLGLLDGLRVTTHHQLFDLLAELAPSATLVRGARFTDNGRICTAAGVSAGIDLSLHLVGRLLGEAAAAETAHYIEYERR